MEEIGNEYLGRNVKRQICAALIANTVLVAHGSISGWLSPALDVLLSDDTPLIDGEISNEELSWLGSISSLGSIVGTFIFSILSSLLGCKRAMIFLALPSIVFWLLVFYGEYLLHLLIARFIMGMTAGGIQSGIIIYVAEISNDNIRGRLGSITPLARNVGVLIASIVGATVDYGVIPAILIYIPIVYIISLYFLPNTPLFHLSRDDVKEAEKSLMFYKGYEGKSECEQLALQLEFERLKNIVKATKANEKLHLKDFCSQTAVRGLIIGAAMAWFLQLTGCFIIINYAMLVFKNANTTMDPHISSIVLAIVQIFGGILSTSLSDTIGRKVLLVLSLLGSAFGLISLSAYLYLNHIGFNLSNYSALPVACLAFVILTACAGIAPLSNVCAVENLPPKIRTHGMVLYTLWYNIVNFFADKYFPILLKGIHLHGCLMIFAVNCFLGTLFVVFYMKETKGRSLEISEK
ncbi:facilitated trehalose transporter Tret1-like [Contarinia nasturtii]|uniref:facilitated trehalose transporter Tret1-like n=1 Tax=Contarinia nasturtii TaxID=265458 RepID=UPI0012D3DA58|nr:facilitated trehalose transporter Tret1-like [Contarinia nasturtii]